MGTRKNRTYLDDEQKAELVRRYKAGEHAKDLAKEFDIHPATVFTISKNFEGKTPVKVLGEMFRKLTDENILEISRRREAGEKMEDLANEFGVHVGTCYDHIRRLKLGLKHLPKRGRPTKSLVLAEPKKARKPEFIDIPLSNVERMTENESNGRLAIIVCQDKNLSTVLGELWK